MSGPQLIRVARRAMATRFEVALYGDDPVRLRAAGEEALDEIERLEAQLSFYRPESELSGVNARAAHEPVAVTPSLFRLLETSKRLSAATGGAFDPTVAPLMRCWGFTRGTGGLPDPDDLERARSQVGMDRVELDPQDLTVRFAQGGMSLDLGSIGKGYAIDRAAGLLRENGIDGALIHGGTSSVAAIGSPPGEEGWIVAIQHPLAAGEEIGAVGLRDDSLSVSGVHGKAFEAGGRRYGHVIDPRTGEPVQGPLLAAVVLPGAIETDAVSTALLVLGESGIPALAGEWPGLRALLVAEGEDAPEDLRYLAWNWDDPPAG